MEGGKNVYHGFISFMGREKDLILMSKKQYLAWTIFFIIRRAYDNLIILKPFTSWIL